MERLSPEIGPISPEKEPKIRQIYKVTTEPGSIFGKARGSFVIKTEESPNPEFEARFALIGKDHPYGDTKNAMFLRPGEVTDAFNPKELQIALEQPAGSFLISPRRPKKIIWVSATPR